MNCPHCGSQIDKSVQKCGFCGGIIIINSDENNKKQKYLNNKQIIIYSVIIILIIVSGLYKNFYDAKIDKLNDSHQSQIATASNDNNYSTVDNETDSPPVDNAKIKAEETARLKRLIKNPLLLIKVNHTKFKIIKTKKIKMPDRSVLFIIFQDLSDKSIRVASISIDKDNVTLDLDDETSIEYVASLKLLKGDYNGDKNTEFAVYGNGGAHSSYLSIYQIDTYETVKVFDGGGDAGAEILLDEEYGGYYINIRSRNYDTPGEISVEEYRWDSTVNKYDLVSTVVDKTNKNYPFISGKLLEKSTYKYLNEAISISGSILYIKEDSYGTNILINSDGAIIHAIFNTSVSLYKGDLINIKGTVIGENNNFTWNDSQITVPSISGEDYSTN